VVGFGEVALDLGRLFIHRSDVRRPL
jgi:hypothetical protein